MAQAAATAATSALCTPPTCVSPWLNSRLAKPLALPIRRPDIPWKEKPSAQNNKKLQPNQFLNCLPQSFSNMFVQTKESKKKQAERLWVNCLCRLSLFGAVIYFGGVASQALEAALARDLFLWPFSLKRRLFYLLSILSKSRVPSKSPVPIWNPSKTPSKRYRERERVLRKEAF